MIVNKYNLLKYGAILLVVVFIFILFVRRRPTFLTASSGSGVKFYAYTGMSSGYLYVNSSGILTTGGSPTCFQTIPQGNGKFVLSLPGKGVLRLSDSGNVSLNDGMTAIFSWRVIDSKRKNLRVDAAATKGGCLTMRGNISGSCAGTSSAIVSEESC